MSSKLDWSPANIAAQWPTGSVVVVRVKLNPNWNYSYFLQTDFEHQEFGDDCQFLLVDAAQNDNRDHENRRT